MTDKQQLHNKLVRDNTPDQLKKQGIEIDIELITDKVRMLRLLLDKLEETAQDAGLASINEDDSLLGELANLETVIDNILQVKGMTRKELKERQDQQEGVQGTFSKGIFLKTTTLESDESEEQE